MLGYKHTKEAIAKMKARFINKKNHPMFGKRHKRQRVLVARENSRYLISKPGDLNPMFGKTHSAFTKKLRRAVRSAVN